MEEMIDRNKGNLSLGGVSNKFGLGGQYDYLWNMNGFVFNSYEYDI